MTNAFAALAEPMRQAIVERLAEGPRSVGEIAAGLPVSRPAVSQHLKVLKEAGLVFDEPAGTRRVYQVDPRAVEALREYFDAFWGHALQNFQRAVEAPTDVHRSKESR
jgi:DNA-binding transcriptional ArsR family regulator